MKKLFLLPLVALMSLAALAPVNYKVDTKTSVIVWTGYKVTGQHTGTVKIKNGTVQFTDGLLTGGSFEIDMTTLANTDLEGEYAPKLINHLKSDDFFGVAKFPTAKYAISQVTALDAKGNYEVTGNLTLKGITQEVKFNANATESNGKVAATGKITVDRSKFNVKYGSGTFYEDLGDKAISDNFDLQVSLSGGR
jgi:polyisoprenoid-binding protein YceI